MKILIQPLEEVKGPRSSNAKVYNLTDILFVATITAVADADSWYDVVEYAEIHEDFSVSI